MLFLRLFFVSMVFLLLVSPLATAKTPKLIFSDSSNTTASEQQKIHIAKEITTDATDFSKASRDTHYLLGGPSHNADYNGTFQNAAGEPDWNGFVGIDCTARTDVNWHVSDFIPITGVYSAWCGHDFGSDHGYGNNWDELLEYVFEIENPSVSTTLDVTATVSYHTEDGYDYSYLTYYKDGRISTNLWEGDGTASSVPVDVSITYLPGEYLHGNQIRLAWRMESDGAWSTDDGLWPGDGGLWVDDCTVTVTNDGVENTAFDDFETGTLGNWTVAFPVSAGDFSKIWTNLGDIDPCLTNRGPQVAFIDDGLVVPGTGGSLCDDWCYGPGGYIVNTTGGLLGPDARIENAVISPVMEWPNQDYNGGYYFFDVYRHQNMDSNSPYIFYQWAVRSVTGTDPEAIESAIWNDRNFVYYGGPDYIRAGDAELNSLLEPGRTFVQVRVSLLEIYSFCWSCNDGYPAPYFDNFRLLAFPLEGPGFSYRQLDLAQDNFPANGTFDFDDLGSNSVRFDMANNISPTDDLYLNPGDSIVIDITSVRAGATIDNLPLIHYTIDANPMFNAFRTSPTTGAVAGDYAMQTVGGIIDTVAGKFAFDLPDQGLLFPGDVLHYYISAEDAIAGAQVQSVTIPRDITEFGDFSDPLKYHSEFTVHALPSIARDGEFFKAPDILFWNDFGDRGGEDKWYFALTNLGLVHGVDYDIYFTQDPTAAVSNGLGGRATLSQLNQYDILLYSSGDLGSSTMSNGVANNDLGTDAALIVEWLNEGNKKLFATGDDLASDLFQSGETTLQLAETWMGLNYFDDDVRPVIGGQATPLVRRIGTSEENPVFKTADRWIAYGHCPGINSFDAVESSTAAVSLAEFTDPSGGSGAYSYSAATLKVNEALGSHVITMPYDFLNIWTDPDGDKYGASLPARVAVLTDILTYFGAAVHSGTPTPVPDQVVFSAVAYPNPFNPSTTINFTLPRSGDVSLKIYNIRGELVKTLVDEHRAMGTGQAVWSGDDNFGGSSASGVYFYELRLDRDVLTKKLMLIK